MNKFGLILCLSLGLTACSPNQVEFAADATKILAPTSVVADMQVKCQQGAPLLAVATSSIAPKMVADTASYAASYCQQLSTGVVPVTTDANTTSWFDKVLTTTAVLAKVAMFVLPLL